jgi:hypothetical protein
MPTTRAYNIDVCDELQCARDFQQEANCEAAFNTRARRSVTLLANRRRARSTEIARPVFER